MGGERGAFGLQLTPNILFIPPPTPQAGGRGHSPGAGSARLQATGGLVGSYSKDPLPDS